MLQKIFGFDPKTMTVKKEIIAGITTFLTMAYILAVNPSILGDAGMDRGAVFTTTILSAIVGTAVMAIYAKLPFVLAKVDTAAGVVPVAMGRDVFDLSNLTVGCIVAMDTVVKADVAAPGAFDRN